MPVNFEIDFIQPLLKDLKDGEYKDIQDYVDAITQYYAATISKGNPVGVPPTLPSPITLGVTVPVATTTNNGYNTTLSRPSQEKFNRALSAYYTAKQLVIGQESIDIKVKTLQGIIDKAKYEKKLIQARIRLIRFAAAEVARLPEYIQSLVDAAKLLVEKYKIEFKELGEVIINSIDTAEIQTAAASDRREAFNQLFPEEASLLNTLSSLDFKDIQQALSAIANIKQFIDKINNPKPSLTNETEEKRYVKLRVTQAADKIVKLVSALSVPEKFISIIDEVRGDFANMESGAERLLNIAKEASKSIGIIKTELQPQIAVAEQWIKIKKANQEQRAKKKLEEQQAVIDEEIKNQTKRKDKSEKKKLFEKYKNDAKDLKKENEELIKKTKSNIKLIGGIITKATKLTNNILDTKVVLEKSVEQYKAEIETLLLKTQDTDLRSDVNDIEQYLNKRSVKELVEPIKSIIKDASISFQDIRVLLERPSEDYDIIKGTLESTKKQLQEIQDDFRKLEKLPPLKRKDGSSITTKRQSGRAKESLITVFVATKELLEDVRVFVKKCKDKTKEFTDKQIKKSEQLLQDIEIAAINALPIPTQVQDIQTKKEAAEEKKNQIKKYKIELGNALKKSKAAISFGTNAGKLISNVVNSDLTPSKNEQILANIAKNRLEYNTVGVSSDSPEYVREKVREKQFVGEVEALREIETYITIMISIIQDLTQTPPSDRATQLTNTGAQAVGGFVNELVTAYNRVAAATQETISQFQEGDIRTISPAVNTIIQTIERLTQSKSSNPVDYLKAINTIKKTLSGGVLGQTLRSTPLTYAFLEVEGRYLLKTKKLLKQLLGVVDEDEEPEEQNEVDQTEGSLSARVRERKQQAEAIKRTIEEKVRSNKLYKLIKDMHEALDQDKGSIIAMTLERVVKKLDEFEAFIKTEITSVVKSLKQKADKRIEKIKQEHEERLKAIAQKKVKNDLVPQSIALNIAATLFWTGAVWQNSETTTFQVTGIAPFKRLRVDGKIDGVEATVRELATNLKNQLNTMQGLVIPNPATGLVPLPFVGYK